MNTTSHPVREAIAHLDDIDLKEATAGDLDALHAAAAAFVVAVEEEWFRRDRGDQ
jgi:hypothetical protein